MCKIRSLLLLVKSNLCLIEIRSRKSLSSVRVNFSFSLDLLFYFLIPIFISFILSSVDFLCFWEGGTTRTKNFFSNIAAKTSLELN